MVSSYIGNGNDPGGTREFTISDYARYQKEPQMSVPNAVNTLVKKRKFPALKLHRLKSSASEPGL